MNNPFATPYQEVDYVYIHFCPITKEMLYVGRGSGSRAWLYKAPNRDAEHSLYLENLVGQGYLPDDWTEVIVRNLSTEAAIVVEREQIALLKPKFNKTPGLALVKFDKEILAKAWELRAKGLSYNLIAGELGVSTMTVYRALNSQTPALGIKLEQN